MNKILKDLNKRTQDKLKASIEAERWYEEETKLSAIEFMIWLEDKR